MRQQVITRTLIVAAGCAALSWATPAAGAPSRRVLLPVQGDTTIPSLSTELAHALKKIQRPAQPSRLQLDELMLAVGCVDQSVACLQKIGKMIDARELLLANATKSSGGVMLTIRWLDVASGADAGKATTALPLDPQRRRPLLLAALRKLFGIPEPQTPATRQTQLPATGGLAITSPIPDVEIEINGQPRGTTPLRLVQLPTGAYDVIARKNGYRTKRLAVTVEGGKTAQLAVELERGVKVSSAGLLGAIQLHTWVVGGIGLASLIVGTGFAASMAAKQNSFDRLKGNTPSEIRRMEELRDEGESNAVVANVLFAVGGGLLLTTAVLSAIDYFRARSAQERPAAPAGQTSFAPRIRVGPGAVQVDVDF